jgi:hypothetical protein
MSFMQTSSSSSFPFDSPIVSLCESRYPIPQIPLEEVDLDDDEAIKESGDSFCKRSKQIPQVPQMSVTEFAGNGLTDEAALNKALSVGDYVTVLKALWSETDCQKKLTWLRQVKSQLHAPLLFELALGECLMTSDPNRVTSVCLPLFRIARFRTQQDLASYPMQLSPDPGQRLMRVYDEVLTIAMNVFLKKPEIDESLMRKKAIKVAVKSLKQQLPPPNWFGDVANFDAANADKKRRAFAEALLLNPN